MRKKIELNLVSQSLTSIEIIAFEQNNPIARYFIYSKVAGTSKGLEINLVSLVLYPVLDLFGNVDFHFKNIHLSQNALSFIKLSANLYSKIFLDYYNVHYKPTFFYKESEQLHDHPSFHLDTKSCYFGSTGGKDSTLVSMIINSRYSNIHNYRVDFDTQEFKHNYHTGRQVLDQNLYGELSIELNVGNGNYYQEHDMPLLFTAPYFSVTDGHPANLIVGIPFDNLNAYRTDRLEFVVTESAAFLHLFQNFIRNEGLHGFKIISPISSLTSFGVYYCLSKIIGWPALKELNSCWQPDKSTGKACMKCPKCERVQYIFNHLYTCPNTVTENSHLSKLFGSFAIEQMLQKTENQSNLYKILLDSRLTAIEDNFYIELLNIFPKFEIQNIYPEDKNNGNY